MTGRLSEAVGSAAGVSSVLGGSDPFSVTRDCLHWIIHLVYTVFDAIVHFIAEIFQSVYNFFGRGFEEACATIWAHVRDFTIHIYKSIESGVEHLVDACNDNSTCSNVAEETKDFALYWFEQFKYHFGFGSLAICIAAIVVLYTCWRTVLGCIVWCFRSIVTSIVRCCGFRQGGISVRTPASSYMSTYRGYVPASSNCARLQSIGATGVVHDRYGAAFDGADSEPDWCCKKLLGFTFVAIVLYFSVHWFVMHNDED